MRLRPPLTGKFFSARSWKKLLDTNVSGCEKLFFSIFLLCLLHSFWAIGVGWNNPIIDEYSFRQTQTEPSAYYLLQGGTWFAYETPVFGFPWSIPMEFLLYQGIVALLVKIFNTPLDQTGRFVSVFFFYASLFSLYGLLNFFTVKRVYRCIFLSLFIASPIYLFWSRTFLIESTALFFCLSYLFWIGFYFQNRLSLLPLFLASICGIAGGLTKATTFLPFLLLAIIWIAWFYFHNRSLSIFKTIFFPLILFCIVPFLTAKFWIFYADSLKELNPIASDFLTSSAIREWNFGTFAQKLSISGWKNYLNRTFKDIFGNFSLALILLLVLPWFTARRVLIFASIAIFVVVALIFTNLHFVHNYYPFASAIFLLIAAGFTLTGLMEKKQKYFKYAGLFFLIITLVSQFYFYQQFWYPKANYYRKTSLQVAERLKNLTSPTGVSLIFTQDWNSLIPYYSQRRALMIFDRQSEAKLDVSMEKVLATNYRVEAILFCGRYRKPIERKRAILQRYHFDSSSSFKNKRCEIYLPLKN
jgi:hypothetical protein